MSVIWGTKYFLINNDVLRKTTYIAIDLSPWKANIFRNTTYIWGMSIKSRDCVSPTMQGRSVLRSTCSWFFPSNTLSFRLFTSLSLLSSLGYRGNCSVDNIKRKFVVKLRKSPIKCFQMLKELFGGNVLSRAQVFKWHEQFDGGCEDVNNWWTPSSTCNCKNWSKSSDN